jgi:cell division protein FtsL
MNKRVPPGAGGAAPARRARLFGGIFRRPGRIPEPAALAPAPAKTGGATGRGYVPLVCLIIVAAAAAFVYHLGVRFEGVRLGYETSKARALQTKLLLERRELRLELASLKAPARVQSDARDRLGMEVPDHDRIIPIGGGRKRVSVSGGAR